MYFAPLAKKTRGNPLVTGRAVACTQAGARQGEA
jgi:hypothetical protein